MMILGCPRCQYSLSVGSLILRNAEEEVDKSYSDKKLCQKCGGTLSLMRVIHRIDKSNNPNEYEN